MFEALRPEEPAKSSGVVSPVQQRKKHIVMPNIVI